MKFEDLIWERCSVRRYENTPVSKEQLEAILDAAKAAPTACNFQPQRIYVLQGEAAKAKLRGCMKFDFGEPVDFLVCYDRRESWKRGYDGKEFGDTDAAIVVTHMMLQAQALGLGSVWIGSFDPAKVQAAFGLPEDIIPAAILPVGYEAAAGGHTPKKRADLQVELL